jgi:hypothetical protein
VCPERLSFRYGVGLACLIGCVYNRNDAPEQQDGIFEGVGRNAMICYHVCGTS